MAMPDAGMGMQCVGPQARPQKGWPWTDTGGRAPGQGCLAVKALRPSCSPGARSGQCVGVGGGAAGAHPGQNVGTSTTAWPLGALLHFWAPCKLQHPQVPSGARGWGVDRSIAARELCTPRNNGTSDSDFR